jgi:pyruvate/2-oxoglutarate dehydrogenase complex dihydrolipoamide acyltransferase (E2) component|tara:strand:+ start:82 stop:318 length:237 start_codon:yes stop_codon:yes gene_type:complete
MLHKIKLPKIAETTDVVVVDQWNVAVGDVVTANQSLASLETDKVTVDFPSPIAGTVTELLVPQGEEARTGEHMCVIDD